MNGATDTIGPVTKRSTSPRPPAVGEEVKKFHDTSRHCPEPYKHWNMECQSKTTLAESVDHSDTTCTDHNAEFTDCLEASSNPSPPAPYKWAQSLQNLLDDGQGVELFEKFLEQESQDTKYLRFWFACRGVKKNDPSDKEGLVKLIKLIEKKAKRISAISDETKAEIKQKLASNTGVDNTIFDAAQREVEAYMIKTTYPNFLRSDLYIQYVSGWQHELSQEKECIVTPEPLEVLPTVHEDTELHIASNKIPLNRSNLLLRNKVSTPSKFKPEGPAGFLRSPYSYSSYHTKYGSFLPASAQDSELQSLSSGAQTDDTMSLTDSNVDLHLCGRSKQKHPQKLSKHSSALINKEKLSQTAFIPRTQRLPEESMKKQNPEEFHEVLCKRLNEYLEKMRSEEKVMDALKQNADCERTEAVSFPNNRLSHKSNASPVFESRFLYKDQSDESEDILNQHISRVFPEESTELQTLAPECISPVLRSTAGMLEKTRVPPRSSACCEPSDLPFATSHKHSHISPFTVPNSMKYRRDHDTHSTDSAMYDCVSDDNIPSGYRSQYPSAVGSSEPVDYSRRCKAHSKRYASKKFSAMTDSSSSCVDSGISLAYESVPSYSKVTHWLEAKQVTEQEREQYMWRNSSTSPVLSRSSSSRKTVGYNSRSGVQDVGCSQWTNTLSQPQDSPGYPHPDATLNEARKKLEDENKAKLRMKSTSGNRSYDTSRMKVPKGYDSYDDGLSHRKPNKKSCSLNVIEAATANATLSNDMTVIGYCYGRLSVPYLSKLPGKNITLRQFKALLSKKGNFRYFFKTASNDFGTGVVFEEVMDDYKVLPMWEGKVFCVIESMDDNTVM